MVEVENYSRELCGGTHVAYTGEIGFMKLINESGVAAGVRRIEAVTGQKAWQYIRKMEEEIAELEYILRSPRGELVSKVKKLFEEEKQLKREIEKLKSQIASNYSQDVLNRTKTINGIKVLSAQVEISDPKTIRDFADNLRHRLGSGIVVLGAKNEDKAILVVMVSKDLASKFPAGEIIKPIASVIGGRGGGRPDMAQAGGKHPEKLEAALNKAYEVIRGMK